MNAFLCHLIKNDFRTKMQIKIPNLNIFSIIKRLKLFEKYDKRQYCFHSKTIKEVWHVWVLLYSEVEICRRATSFKNKKVPSLGKRALFRGFSEGLGEIPRDNFTRALEEERGLRVARGLFHAFYYTSTVCEIYKIKDTLPFIRVCCTITYYSLTCYWFEEQTLTWILTITVFFSIIAISSGGYVLHTSLNIPFRIYTLLKTSMLFLWTFSKCLFIDILDKNVN